MMHSINLSRRTRKLIHNNKTNLFGILAFPPDLFPSRYGMVSNDVTPKNLYDFDPNLDENHSLSDNYRYQGFPAEGFEKPRNPKTLNQIEQEQQKEEETSDAQTDPTYFGYKKWFDTNKPLGGSAHTGLQYGSEDFLAPTHSLTSPRAVRDPFHERTSAELRKYKKLEAEVAEGIQKMKAAKIKKMNMEMEEKRKDFEQLKRYDPWGKPGAGAPLMSDNRKQKLNEQLLGTKPEDLRPSEYLREYGDFHANFSKPGGGAPLRTSSGGLKTELRGDPSIRFQSTKDGPNIYDKEVRYKAHPEQQERLRRDLEAQQKEFRERQTNDRLRELKQEIEMAAHNPYGKPGGGAPIQRSAGPITGRNITLTTDMEKLRSVERRRDQQWLKNNFDNTVDRGNSGYNPWGKGYGAPMRDSYGDTMRYKFADPKMGIYTDRSEGGLGNSLDFENGRGGAGAPIKTEDGHIQTRYPITMRRDAKGDSTIREQMPGKSPRHMSNDPELQIFDPWGKGGGGAPLLDNKGQKITQVFGKIQTERLSGDARSRHNAKQDYRTELQMEMEEQRENRYRQDQDLRQGNGEFAAVIKAGRVGRPRINENGVLGNQHLGSTDVTQGPRFKTRQSQEYLSFLEREAEERDQMKRLDRLKDNQEWTHHQEAMNNFWGRPGGGAPMNQGNRKGKLDSMIHTPRSQPVDFYSKSLPSNKEPYNYVRNTTDSTYKNMYDFDPNFRRASPHGTQGKGSYSMQPPWASNEKEGEVF